MSYNLVILVQVLEPYLHLWIPDHAKPQIESILKISRSLVQIFDKIYHPTRSSRLDDLEGRIRDVAYLAEDIIESCMMELATASDSEDGVTSKLDLTRVMEELESIKEEVLKIQAEWLPDTTAVPADVMVSPEPRQDLSIIVGRGRDWDLEARIIGGPSKLQVFSVVGVKGLGKSALVRCLYDRVFRNDHFQSRVWIPISEGNDARANMLHVLRSMRKLVDGVHRLDDDELGALVNSALKYKKYLLVFDGIWDIDDWKKLVKFLPDDNIGSRILLTSTEVELATYVNPFGVYQMPALYQKESRSLLRKKVFGAQKPPPEFEQIAIRIAVKCMGSPLALTLLAGILSTSRMPEFWELIEESTISMDSYYDLHMHILSMSYEYLPYHLRPCFLYMGVLSPDISIRASELIRLWIAEGFVEAIGDRSLDDTAESYLKALIGRNLIALYKIKGSKMKSVINRSLVMEFCQKKAMEQKFSWSRTLRDPNLPVDEQVMHRVSILSSQLTDGLELPSHHARTFIGRGRSPLDLAHLFVGLRFLRVLSVLGIEFNRFPVGILELALLRYLAVSCRAGLPSSISRLQNLQFLIINRLSSFRAVSLPSDLWKMTQLRVVKCSNTCIWYCPEDMKGVVLEKLQKLTNLQLLRVTHEFLDVVPNIRQLGIFCNIKMRTVLDLACLNKLEKLKCSSDWSLATRDFLSCLTFPRSLRRLTLTLCRIHPGFMGVIGSLPCLETLNLFKSDFLVSKSEATEPEWQPAEGEFQSLELLLMEDLNLVHWKANSTHFPKLQKLYFRRCCSMLRLSSDIGNIPTLEMIRMDKVSPSMVASATRIGKEQEERGNKLRVLITN